MATFTHDQIFSAQVALVNEIGQIPLPTKSTMAVVYLQNELKVHAEAIEAALKSLKGQAAVVEYLQEGEIEIEKRLPKDLFDNVEKVTARSFSALMPFFED